MTRIEIKLIDPKDTLPKGTIRIPCYGKCRDKRAFPPSTLHDRVVRDRWENTFKRPKNPERSANGGKGFWKCRACGNIARF